MIVALPAATPLTRPEVAPTVATAVLLLFQLPPEGVELNVFDAPIHIAKVPVIAVGKGLTVTVVVYTVDVQADVPELLTVNEYVLVVVGVTVGLATVEVNPDGPLHA